MKNYIQKIILLSILLLAVQATKAQENKKHLKLFLPHAFVGFQKGDGYGLNISVLDNKYGGIRYSFSVNALEVRNTPEAIKRYYNDYDRLFSHKVHYIYAIPTRFKRIRFLIDAGFDYTEYELVQYFKPNPNHAIVTYTKFESSFGFSARASLDLPILQMAGLQFSLYANLNKVRPTFGPSITLNLGRLRDL